MEAQRLVLERTGSCRQVRQEQQPEQCPREMGTPRCKPTALRLELLVLELLGLVLVLRGLRISKRAMLVVLSLPRILRL